nr:unnamed protein product [Callosobruchus analis]
MAGDTDVPSSQCDKNCEICGDSIRKTCVKCEGDNCNVILHTKCFETIAKIFFAERKNWRCKNCASKHRSTTGSTSSDVLILRHEVDCLTREKLLLNELNVELKSNNQLLREKLFSTQMSYAEKVKISPPGEIVRATTSYDNGKKVNKPTTGVVVKANSSSVSNDDIIADLQKNVNPPGLKLCLNGIKKIKNGVIIKCEDKKSQGILEEHVKNKLGSKYAINQTRLFKPRLLINNIRFQENATPDEILADLRTRNDIGDDEMKIVTTLKNGNTLSLVLEIMGKKLNKGTLKIGHINVRSLIPSIVDFEELVISNNLDIIGVSETWLSDDIPSDLLSIPDFNVYRNDRQGRGGGVAVYVRSSIKCKVVDIETPTNALECMIITFKVRHSSFCVGIFYRPPKENLLEAIQFLDNKLASLRSEYDELVLLGDFNVNVLIDNKLNDCLQTYGLKQIITEPTRITETSATLLDPIFVSNIEKVIANGTVNADTFSDHAMAFCDISCNLHSKPKYVTHRDFAMLDIDQFYIDLHGIHWENLIYINDIESKINFLTSNINALFDKHCPIKTVRVTKPKAPWLTPNIRLILKERDKALSKYKAHPSSTNWREYKEKRNFALLAIRNEKAAFLKELQWNNSTKLLYQSLKGMHIQNNNCINIPDNLANPYEINDYFTTMFLKNNEHCVDKIFMYTFSRFSDNNTFSLRPIDSNTLSTIISGITSNASGLDGISLHMLKLCLPVINDYLLHIINSCLEIGYFPDQWKTALVIPKPKCSNPASFNDLRPISLLPVLSKLLERAVHMQLFEYLTRTKILPLHQSGFQKHHSTTTSLAYLSDSILSSLDKKLMNILALLDFSKAFDTLNHSLLIAKCKYYGFDEIACKFIKSYLVGRAQRVVLNNQASTSSKITSGVPQGSVLGPLLFLLYTSDLKDCIKSCSIQSFADDTQLRCEFKPEDFQLAERQLNDDLDRVSKYCQSHNLKINPTKSKLILFGTKRIEII